MATVARAAREERVVLRGRDPREGGVAFAGLYGHEREGMRALTELRVFA